MPDQDGDLTLSEVRKEWRIAVVPLDETYTHDEGDINVFTVPADMNMIGIVQPTPGTPPIAVFMTNDFTEESRKRIEAEKAKHVDKQHGPSSDDQEETPENILTMFQKESDNQAEGDDAPD